MVPSVLIDPTQLSQQLHDSNWIIFDCRHDLSDPERGARLYQEGHLPGAYFAPVDTALSGKKSGVNGRHPLPAASDFAAFLERHGVTRDRQVVVYDDVGGQYAARFWWLARWIGFTRVAVLDGGLPKWLAEGHPLTKEIPPPPNDGAVVARPDESFVVNAIEVLERIRRGSALVIDARTPERFRGESEPIDRVAGHIPTARNRPFKSNLNSDLTFRAPAELKSEYQTLLDGRNPEEVIHQCGSGITACVNLLAMEHAGLRGSKLYAGSWSEWIADPARPIARGP